MATEEGDSLKNIHIFVSHDFSGNRVATLGKSGPVLHHLWLLSTYNALRNQDIVTLTAGQFMLRLMSQ